jgi:hypothetical protein
VQRQYLVHQQCHLPLQKEFLLYQLPAVLKQIFLSVNLLLHVKKIPGDRLLQSPVATIASTPASSNAIASSTVVAAPAVLMPDFLQAG